MNPAIRPLVPVLLGLSLCGSALYAYQALSSPWTPRDDLIAKAWTIGYGDSEASVISKLGKPVREIDWKYDQRLLRFERSGQAVEVVIGGNGVNATKAIPNVSDERSLYQIVFGRPGNPSHAH